MTRALLLTCLLAGSFALLSEGAEYAVKSADAKKACELSAALKGSARAVSGKALAAVLAAGKKAKEVAVLRASLSALERRTCSAGNGDTRVNISNAMQALDAHLKGVEEDTASASQQAEIAADNSTEYTAQASRLAGHIDGLVAMLATWYAGKRTATNNAMCIAKAPSTAKVTWAGRLDPGSNRNDAGDLAGCFADPPTASDKNTVAEVTTKAKKVAALVEAFNQAKPVQAQPNTEDDTCPFLTAHDSGTALWNAAQDMPYVKLGGLWALTAGNGGSTKITLDASEPKDSGKHTPDSRAPANAAEHAAITKATGLGTHAEHAAEAAHQHIEQAQQKLEQTIALAHGGHISKKTLAQWIDVLQQPPHKTAEDTLDEGTTRTPQSAAGHLGEDSPTSTKTQKTAPGRGNAERQQQQEHAHHQTHIAVAAAVAGVHCFWQHLGARKRESTLA